MYRAVPADDEQYACSKHVEVNYWNKLEIKSASCWFILYGYVIDISSFWLYLNSYLSINDKYLNKYPRSLGVHETKEEDLSGI